MDTNIVNVFFKEKNMSNGVLSKAVVMLMM